jgi:hypothetical protein
MIPRDPSSCDRNRRGAGWGLGVIVGVSLLTTACVLVMDADFDKYQAASLAGPADDASPDSAGGVAGAPVEDADVDASTGGTGAMGGTGGFGGTGTGGTSTGGKGGTGGTGGKGGTGGVSGTGGTGGASPTCDDGVQNQGELGIDCGGPCPACPPVGFTHTENFDAFPSWGPDGAYTVTGSCHEDNYVDGWAVTNAADAFFPNASGYYAAIYTDGVLYIGFPCDDSMVSPELQANQASQVTVEFDSSLLTDTDTKASVWLVRDGVSEEIWQRSTDKLNEHVTIGPLSTAGVTKLRIFFRYEGEFEFYWKVDNVRVEGM